MKQLLLIIPIIPMLVGCNAKVNSTIASANDSTKVSQLDSLSWIIGTWEMKNGSATTTETWYKANDSLFKGNSITLGDKLDTLFAESITIEMRGPEMYYIPVIQDQNGGSPTLFKCTRKSNSMVVFDNPAHDFPQTIKYELRGDSLIAEISGVTEKVFHAEQFPMVRKNKKTLRFEESFVFD